MPPPANRIYNGHDRPDVEVLIHDETGDTWCEGELRAWQWIDDAWTAQVQWRRGPGQGTSITRFPAHQVRQVQDVHSNRRHENGENQTQRQ